MRISSSVASAWRLALAVVIVAVVASGCLSASVALVVNEDDSGSFSAHVSVDPEFLELMADPSFGEFETPEDACADMHAADDAEPDNGAEVLAFPTKTEIVNANGECSRTETVTWGPDSLDDALAEVGEFGSLVSRTADGWQFHWHPMEEFAAEADVDLSAQVGRMAELATVFGIEPGTSLITITLPGVPIEHNATSVDGGALSWRYELHEMPAGPLYAIYSLEEDAKPASSDQVASDTAPAATQEEPPPTGTTTTTEAVASDRQYQEADAVEATSAGQSDQATITDTGNDASGDSRRAMPFILGGIVGALLTIVVFKRRRSTTTRS